MNSLMIEQLTSTIPPSLALKTMSNLSKNVPYHLTIPVFLCDVSIVIDLVRSTRISPFLLQISMCFSVGICHDGSGNAVHGHSIGELLRYSANRRMNGISPRNAVRYTSMRRMNVCERFPRHRDGMKDIVRALCRLLVLHLKPVGVLANDDDDDLPLFLLST
jgi:hypothetical protein